MKTHLNIISFIAVLLVFSGSAISEQVLIPGHYPSNNVTELPKRGQSMDNVRYYFGNPNQEKLPVGNPPITQWIYDGFSVFFEKNHVIHTVNTDTLILPNTTK